MPKEPQEKTLALIAQAVSVRHKLVDRVVAMIIEMSPEVAADKTVSECLSSLRLIQDSSCMGRI